jgi:NADH dehydrogenase
MPAPKTIAVTGATGFVGRYIVRELLACGYRVRALVRDTHKAREVLPRDAAGLDFVASDVLDGSAPAKLVTGCDACVHLVGIIREVRGGHSPQTFEGMHVDAPRAMADACKAAGVARFLHMSALGADPEGRAPYQRTKYHGEQVVRRSGLDWTIFRPSFIHGPDGEFVQMVSNMCSGQAPPWYFIPYFGRPVADTRVPLGGVHLVPAKIQPVAVQDVAAAFVQALENPKTIHEIYNLVGPDVFTWPEVLQFFRDTLPGASHTMPVSVVPGEPSVIAAKVAKALGLGGLIPFDEGQAIMAMEDSTSELNKVKEHLHLSPKPFKQTVLEYAARV